MTNEKDPRKHHESMSNPEKSFEAGKKGGKSSADTTGQASNILNASKIVGNADSSEKNNPKGGKQDKR